MGWKSLDMLSILTQRAHELCKIETGMAQTWKVKSRYGPD